VRLFSSVLERSDAGDYWLLTPAERGRIDVDDAPFLAVALEVQNPGPAQTLRFRTNVEDWVTLDAGHPLRLRRDTVTGADIPYIPFVNGWKGAPRPAGLLRIDRAGAGGAGRRHGQFGIWSMGTFFPLASTATIR